MDPQSPPPPTTVRRNPPRRAKQTPSATSALDFSTSSASTAIAPFPINEILSKPVKNESEPGNLKVFLRIRPLEIRSKPSKNLKTKSSKLARGKSVCEMNSRSCTNNLCLVVNDSSSVTLTAPSSVLDNSSKRTKSELYDGFSFVFPQDSVQEDVFEKAMCPLVTDFIEGKSALLAAMGPTGSGKTHTMFGTARQPGIVPLALRHIFSHEMKREDQHMSRLYYLSMFEIHSERGKGEKIYDLSCDGVDLTFQLSTIKGLKETRISDANEAESLVARCLLKRATAATSANSQSSRSQCIINIRCAVEDLENNISIHSPILTIADLAGAERERKTGNQGSRLLESNFINNTSMVFGLCLRSLLEHQKNPKKAFEKHFKNSLLTRYLKEYLEGKRRMTLILTVKPGEHDYLDTSFLLRQASPYMKIKFNNVEDVPNVHRQKRNTASLLIGEDHKRRKVNGCEVEVVDPEKIDGNSSLIKDELVGDEVQNVNCILSKSVEASDVGQKFNSELQVELETLKRNDEVTRKFSKAIWNVLKQYKGKLVKSENEVQSLKEALEKEKHQVSKLMDELKEIKSCCSCNKISTDQICVTEVVPSNLTPASPGISTLTVNESEVAGLKGILLNADLIGDSKSVHHTSERSSLALTMHKNSALDIVHSSFPSGMEKKNHFQLTESLIEEDNLHGHVDSPSNSTTYAPFELDLAETGYEAATSSRKLDSTPKDSLLAGKHISPKEENVSDEGLDGGDRNKATELLCSGSFEGVDYSEVVAVSCQKVDLVLSAEDAMNHGFEKEKSLQEVKHESEGVEETVVDQKEFSADKSLIGVPSSLPVHCSNSHNEIDSGKKLIEKEECFQEFRRKPEDLEETISGLKSSKNENLGVLSSPSVHHFSVSDEVEADAIIVKNEIEKEESFPELKHKPEEVKETVDGLKVHSEIESLVVHHPHSQKATEVKILELDALHNEGDKENDRFQILSHSENTKNALSPKSIKAAKPKRKLLPASTLLLKEFSSIGMEVENAMDIRSKPSIISRERSQGSASLIRLLTNKK